MTTLAKLITLPTALVLALGFSLTGCDVPTDEELRSADAEFSEENAADEDEDEDADEDEDEDGDDCDCDCDCDDDEDEDEDGDDEDDEDGDDCDDHDEDEDDEDDEDDEKDNQRRGFADQSSRDMSSRLAGTFNSMRNLLRKSG